MSLAETRQDRRSQAFSHGRPLVLDRPAWLEPRRQEQLMWAFVALALAARAVRFLLCFPLWEDECFLVSNLCDRSYRELLLPLNYHQVAPLLFLVIELTAVKLLGFNEWSLRLFPFVCGIGSVMLFRHLAGRLLKGPAKLIAVAAFCASYSGIRYAAEAKPYGADQLVALALLTAAVEWWRDSHRQLWLPLLVAFVPIAIGLSYPAVFVAGGVSLLMAVVLHGEKRGGWLGWLVYNASLTAALWLLITFAAKSQSESELAWMQDYWKEHLPSLASPAELIGWFFKTHTGDLLAIPLGGERGASTISFLLVAAGIAALMRARQHRLLLLCLMPAVLNLAAAFLGRFPYGGHVKFSQYLAPAICLLFGLGAAAAIPKVSRVKGVATDVERRWTWLAVGLAVLAMIPLGTIGRDFCCPYKSPTDVRYRNFACWFWPSIEYGGESACLYGDLGLEFAPGTFKHLGWAAMYQCNQRIYSPRHSRGEAVDWRRISDQWPLHVVEYRAQVYPYEVAAQREWLDSMAKRFELVSRNEFPSLVFDQRGQNLLCADRLVLYKFVPRANSLNR